MAHRSLVTGGAGFIGSHVADALVKRGDRVCVLDDFSTGLLSNLNDVRRDIEIVRATICDRGTIRKAMKKVDYVFHLAANRAVVRSVEDPCDTNDVNVTGTLNVLVAARDAGVRRVIFSSSAAVYGDAKKFPSSEKDPLIPASPYAVSKLVGEHYCQLFTKLYGLETVSLRYFNIFGPRQNPESKYSMVIPMFIYSLVSNKRPEVHWDGRQSRDFIYVDDVVHGNLLARSVGRASGEIFNIGSGEECSVLNLLAGLKKILKKPSITPRFAPKREGDVRRTFADIIKAKRILGFKVQIRFHEGLEKTVDWFLASGTLRKVVL